MEKYVEIRPAVMEGYPDAHSVVLKVTNQQFVIGRWASETKDEAEWLRDMLCVALAKIVADAHGQATPDSNEKARPTDEAERTV